jgi:transaldolase
VAKSRLHELAEHGQSVWIDNLARSALKEGKLARMMEEDAVTGVTSNPTIFQKAIASGDAYDEQLLEVAKTESDPKEIFLQLSAQDIAEACELLEPVWERTNGLDGFVSWEVDPTLAYDRESTYEEMIRLHEWIDRPNLYVKIPATKPGLGAIEDAVAHGKNINVTLIFSLRRHQEVIEAYLRGLERLVAAGKSPAKVQSVASFFVSRVDTEADKRLDAAGKPELKGQLAVANARLAYENFLEAFSGPRWEFLESKGANVQRPLWASTSVKNPDYRDVMYVEELIGPNTVNTMPDETIEAFQDHGEVRGDTILEGIDKARKLFEDLAAAGVDYDDVSLTLEEEGVQKFADSFEELLAGIRAKRDELVAA